MGPTACDDPHGDGGLLRASAGRFQGLALLDAYRRRQIDRGGRTAMSSIAALTTIGSIHRGFLFEEGLPAERGAVTTGFDRRIASADELFVAADVPAWLIEAETRDAVPPMRVHGAGDISRGRLVPRDAQVIRKSQCASGRGRPWSLPRRSAAPRRHPSERPEILRWSACRREQLAGLASPGIGRTSRIGDCAIRIRRCRR